MNVLTKSSEVKICKFDNSYQKLPERFYTRLNPTPVKKPELLKLNLELALQLGIEISEHTKDDLTGIFCGNLIPQGANPIAMAYAGHQFGHFTPQLGDGRAILLGEILDSSGSRVDVQLKGSGITPFSRQGDGRAALGPVLREYLVSEAMHALGIPSTRALAAAITGEPVYRETVLPGAILTRVSQSYVRVGTFEFFAVRGDEKATKILADYVINRLYPHISKEKNPYSSLLREVSCRQAKLVAKWMSVGFIHGVMNTDNMSISGETIDYGPCAFMDKYNPKTVFSSIDSHGRYAYQNQPSIAQWNLIQLAESILPLISEDTDKGVKIARDILEEFPKIYEQNYLEEMRQKLGFISPKTEDVELISNLVELMEKNEADHTLTFRLLAQELAPLSTDFGLSARDLFKTPEDFDNWKTRWKKRVALEKNPAKILADVICKRNPVIIPRNHLVESVLSSAIEDGNLGPFNEFLDALSSPFDNKLFGTKYSKLPDPPLASYQTFCGT